MAGFGDSGTEGKHARAGRAAEQEVIAEDVGPDAGRYIAVFFGAVLVAVGVALSLLIFIRIGAALEDPRTLKPQLDRWEFVVKGYTGALPESALEVPDRVDPPPATEPEVPVLTGDDGVGAPQAVEPEKSESERLAEFVGQVGSHASRPIAISVMLMLVLVLSRIALGMIWAGARLLQK